MRIDFNFKSYSQIALFRYFKSVQLKCNQQKSKYRKFAYKHLNVGYSQHDELEPYRKKSSTETDNFFFNNKKHKKTKTIFCLSFLMLAIPLSYIFQTPYSVSVDNLFRLGFSSSYCVLFISNQISAPSVKKIGSFEGHLQFTNKKVINLVFNLSCVFFSLRQNGSKSTASIKVNFLTQSLASVPCEKSKSSTKSASF